MSRNIFLYCCFENVLFTISGPFFFRKQKLRDKPSKCFYCTVETMVYTDSSRKPRTDVHIIVLTWHAAREPGRGSDFHTRGKATWTSCHFTFSTYEIHIVDPSPLSPSKPKSWLRPYTYRIKNAEFYQIIYATLVLVPTLRTFQLSIETKSRSVPHH